MTILSVEAELFCEEEETEGRTGRQADRPTDIHGEALFFFAVLRKRLKSSVSLYLNVVIRYMLSRVFRRKDGANGGTNVCRKSNVTLILHSVFFFFSISFVIQVLVMRLLSSASELGAR